MKEFNSNFNEDNIDTILFGEYPTVTLSARCRKNGRFCDVSISAFSEEKTFSELAWIETEPNENYKVKFRPKLTYVLGNRDVPFFAVLGSFKLVFINYKNKSIFEVLSFNRKKNEDQGFYFFKVLSLKEDFIVVYESGACRITNSGVALWHINLMWDDIYINSNEKYLYYSSEFGDSLDWVINIESGEKSSLDQLR